MTKDWPKIIHDILQEHRISVRKLSRVSGISLSTLKRLLNGSTAFRVVQLEYLLTLLGYRIDAIPIGEPSSLLRRPKKIKPERAPRKLIRPVGCERGW